MQLEQFTKKQLIEMVKQQQKTFNWYENFYIKKINELEQQIRQLKNSK